MDNKERQKLLDKEKWKESEMWKKDMSGYMSYCLYCKPNCMYQECIYPQKERVNKCLCAKAYNVMMRKKI